MELKQIISLELPNSLKNKLKEEANEKEMSMSALIRFIIKQYYTKEPWEKNFQKQL